LADKIADRLRDSIVLGQLPSGMRLVETELAAQFGVSRNTLREALRTLQRENLITSRPHKGTYVASLTDQEIFELVSIRSVLEGLAARLLAERGTPEQLEELRRQVGELLKAAESGNAHKTHALDLRLHRTIWEMSGHRRLLQILSSMHASILTYMLVAPDGHKTLTEYVAPHTALVDAIASGDASLAERVMRQQTDATLRDLLEARLAKSPAPSNGDSRPGE
jgi:DNA-binding GntR family transcriptional regulator